MNFETIGTVLALTVLGIIIWLILGFVIALVFYEDKEVDGQQLLGLIIAWPVVLLIKVGRGIVYLYHAFLRGVHFASEN